MSNRIAPCLWFDHQAEEAANHYCEIFPNSRITLITRFSEVGQEIHGKEPGSVMTVEFELDGQPYTALNGGPMFQFSEAISLQVRCANQQEVDTYWERLGEGGDPDAQQCGWLKDKFGVSWQVVPTILYDHLASGNQAGIDRAMAAMFTMKKLDIELMQTAFRGE